MSAHQGKFIAAYAKWDTAKAELTEAAKAVLASDPRAPELAKKALDAMKTAECELQALNDLEATT